MTVGATFRKSRLSVGVAMAVRNDGGLLRRLVEVRASRDEVDLHGCPC